MDAPTTHTTAAGPSGDVTDPVAPGDTAAEDLLEDEMLVEEVSIDGMCGVY